LFINTRNSISGCMTVGNSIGREGNCFTADKGLCAAGIL
jgi:hypothetical protein